MEPNKPVTNMIEDFNQHQQGISAKKKRMLCNENFHVPENQSFQTFVIEKSFLAVDAILGCRVYRNSVLFKNTFLDEDLRKSFLFALASCNNLENIAQNDPFYDLFSMMSLVLKFKKKFPNVLHQHLSKFLAFIHNALKETPSSSHHDMQQLSIAIDQAFSIPCPTTELQPYCRIFSAIQNIIWCDHHLNLTENEKLKILILLLNFQNPTTITDCLYKLKDSYKKPITIDYILEFLSIKKKS